MDNIEEDYRGIDNELVPALEHLIGSGVQFETEDLEPFIAPFLKYDFLKATQQGSAVKILELPSLQSL